eukprot:TRINITY_DN4981_c0_g1_i1.p1 TRINITY_DN4981_c0_g1~~TRINITY_DN4981_c0_g1_i1.p1  ORF type:complete len:535 (-),score=79.64 TRINITY_DN4981_c0_g1_i1:305-1885(-)
MQSTTFKQSLQHQLCHAKLQVPHLRQVYRPRSRLFISNAVKTTQEAEVMDASTMQLISDITQSVQSQHSQILAANASLQIEGIAENMLRTKVLASILDLQSGLLERETEVRLMLLAALCGEHLLLLGPPGTAKSELARRLSTLCGGKYFERLLTRFSVPEELFGPLSMRGLENDQYVRQIQGYLPTAEVAFIDEIFKANSAILNALLTLLNERLFDNGNQRLPVPLLCLVGASNELPESEELDALYDRFLIRRQVGQVTNAQIATLARLAAGRVQIVGGQEVEIDNGVGAQEEISMKEFQETRQLAIDAVDLPESVVDLLTSLRNYLQEKAEPPIYVSDRRFMKAINLLQVASYADGRDAINEYDCLLLEHVFGNRPDDAQKVRTYMLETIASDPGLQQTELVFLGLFGRVYRLLEQSSESELEEVLEEVEQVVQLLESRHASLCNTLDGEFPELRQTVWQSEASVQQAVQTLTPQMTENKRKAEELLREVMILRQAIQGQVSSAVLQKLLPKRFKQYERGISSRA